LPKSRFARVRRGGTGEFQYSSTSRNCRNQEHLAVGVCEVRFQYSSTSRNCRNPDDQRQRRLNFRVSVLFNESKLPKSRRRRRRSIWRTSFSTLQRVEIAEIDPSEPPRRRGGTVSVLFNESKLPKLFAMTQRRLCL